MPQAICIGRWNEENCHACLKNLNSIGLKMVTLVLMNGYISCSFGAYTGSKHMDVEVHLGAEKMCFQEGLFIQHVTSCNFLLFIFTASMFITILQSLIYTLPRGFWSDSCSNISSHSLQHLRQVNTLLTFWCFVSNWPCRHPIYFLVNSGHRRQEKAKPASLLENNLKIGACKSVTHMYFALPYHNW